MTRQLTFFGAFCAVFACLTAVQVDAANDEPRAPSGAANEAPAPAKRSQAREPAAAAESIAEPLQAEKHAAPAQLSLVVFERGNPVRGIELKVNGKRHGVTDADGALWANIPSGRRDVVLVRDGKRLVELDFLTDAGESLQMLVTLPETPAAKPRIDVASTAGGEQVKIVRDDTPLEEKGPPGALSGRIVAADSGAPISGARLYFAGQATDATTDQNGRYAVELPAGNYRLSVVHPDYATQKLDNVRVIPGKQVTSNIELSPAGLALADYVVTAPYVEGSISSVFDTQREAEGVIDIIGAEQMARTGDSDAAQALGRVTGLTIEDGQYAVIRGQPERYTFSTFNGSPLPSPDPIQRIVPLDLFPAGVLKSIAVQKSYTADQPGEFGGGLIALSTRDIPDEAFGAVSVSTGFNSVSTNKDGLTYAGGGTDFLGFDDGTRELPSAAASEENLGNLSIDQQNAIGAQFPNSYNVTNETLPPDSGLSIVGGGAFDLVGGKIGVLGSFAWDREYRNREQIERTYSAAGGDTLILANDFTSRRTDMLASLSSLLAFSAEWDRTKLSSNTFFIQDTTGRTEVIEGLDATSEDNFVRDSLLSWDEQQLLVQQVLGEHDFDFVKLGWRGLIGSGSRDAPDRRTYRYQQLPDQSFIFVGDPSGVTREYNETQDSISGLGLDITVPVIARAGFKADAKIGGSMFDQTRESQTRRFIFTPTDELGEALFSPNPEEFLQPDQIGESVTFTEETLGIDDYSGETSVDGVYLMGDFRVPKVARLVAGVRREEAQFSALTFQGAEGDGDVPGGFEGEDILPAVDFTYFWGETMQIRAAWGKTVSRPNLNELSPAVYIDPRTGDEFVGNPDLQPAEITSYDLRWEWYPSSTEQLTAGVFRKDYTDPIELTLQPLGESSILNSVDNADEAKVTGLEISARAGLERLRTGIGGGPRWFGPARGWVGGAGWLDNMYVQGNATFINSEVMLAETGVATQSARPLQGQAENIFNLQLGYDGATHDFTLAYNRVGERLYRPGTQTRPNIFREPVDLLDATYRFQVWDALTIGLELSNLLNPTLNITQGGQIYESYEAGISANLFLNWTLW